MAGYRVLIKPSAAKEIDAIGAKNDRQRIVTRILALADEPRPVGCEKLAGAEGRYREGDGVRRAAILIGPEFGTVQRPDLVKAAREAGTVARSIAARRNTALNPGASPTALRAVRSAPRGVVH